MINSPYNAFQEIPVLKLKEILPSNLEINQKIDLIFRTPFNLINSHNIPKINDVELYGNEACKMKLTMLFIDIRNSTEIVASTPKHSVAAMYSSFFYGIVNIIKKNSGSICSYNGDGILCAFAGNNKIKNAITSALNMSWFMNEVLKPRMDTILTNSQFKWGIGIDLGEVLIIKSGIKNNNDFVWVGNATNYAVKLASVNKNESDITIFNNLYEQIDNNLKFYPDFSPIWNKSLIFSPIISTVCSTNAWIEYK